MTKFTWITKRWVRSDTGFEVQSVSRFELRYLEHGRPLTISFDPGKLLDGRYCVILDRDTFDRWDDGELISQAKQQEILANFTEAMEIQNIGIEFYDEDPIEP